jgi:hypothetical protein
LRVRSHASSKQPNKQQPTQTTPELLTRSQIFSSTVIALGMAGGGIVVVEVEDVVDDSHRVVSEDDCEEAVAPMLMLLCGGIEPYVCIAAASAI